MFRFCLGCIHFSTIEQKKKYESKTDTWAKKACVVTTISTNLHTKRLDRGLGHEIGKTEIFFLRMSLAVVFHHAKARVVEPLFTKNGNKIYFSNLLPLIFHAFYLSLIKCKLIVTIRKQVNIATMLFKIKWKQRLYTKNSAYDARTF